MVCPVVAHMVHDREKQYVGIDYGVEVPMDDVDPKTTNQTAKSAQGGGLESVQIKSLDAKISTSELTLNPARETRLEYG
jgi:hypothetical protein